MGKKKVFSFDFDDGRGEVPAHQHVNKNGEAGGWVEDNCTVSDDSHISDNSRVYNSRVYNNSSVYNSSVDNSSVDNSRVDNSSVYNSSVDNAKLNHTKRVYSQSPIGSRNDKASAFISVGSKEIVICAGCFAGTVDEFQEKVLKTHGHNKYGKEYLAFIQNARTHFEIWQSEFTDTMPAEPEDKKE